MGYIYKTRRAYTTHLRTADDGATWVDIGDAAVAFLTEAVYDLAGQGHLWAIGSDRILRRSTDDGVTWSSVGNAIPGTYTPRDLCYLPDHRIVVMLRDETDQRGGVVVRSSDLGATWQQVFVGGDTFYPRHKSLTYHPETNALLVISRNRPTQNMPGAGIGPDEVLRSTDAGASWVATRSIPPRGDPGHESFFVTRSGVILLVRATWANIPRTGEIFRSTDGGQTWAQVLSVNETAGFNLCNVHYRTRIAQHQSSGRLWWMGRWYSDDDGVTWTDGGDSARNPGLDAGSYDLGLSIAATANALVEASHRSANFRQYIWRSTNNWNFPGVLSHLMGSVQAWSVLSPPTILLMAKSKMRRLRH
jgi:hypothetical protein